jgi:hypothetical protein
MAQVLPNLQDCPMFTLALGIKGTSGAYWKGKKLSEETKQKIREARATQPCPRTGRKHSEETKRRWSLSRKGSTPWNKGKKGYKLSEAAKQKKRQAIAARKQATHAAA